MSLRKGNKEELELNETHQLLVYANENLLDENINIKKHRSSIT
jgi:hypothetical protein